VESLFIIEIAIAPVDRQFGRCETGEKRAGRTLDHPVARSGNDDDQLVTEPGRGFQFGFDICPDSAALGRVKSTDIDDPHASPKAGMGR